MPFERELAQRRRSAADASALIRPVDSLAIGLGPCQPAGFLGALGARDDFEQLTASGSVTASILFTRRA
jgi:hypothetical protein